MLIHRDKLRWLLWLRWRMLIRTFIRGGVGQIIGGILQILFSVLFMGAIAVGTFFVYRFAPAPFNAEILFVVLAGLLLSWIVLPLFDISRNEGLDLSKLALFPLTRAELIISLLLSSLLDIPMVGLFLVLAAVVAGWAFSLPLALFSLLIMLFFAIQLVGIGQLIVALFQGVLNNRRFRDFSIILTVFLFALIYLAQFAFRALASSGFQDGLQQGTFSNYLQWLPSGVAARAIQQASIGNWGNGFLWFAVLVVIDVVILYGWLIFTQRSLTATEDGGKEATSSKIKTRPRPASTTTPAPGVSSTNGSSRWQGILPVPVVTIMLKDLKYLRRDPQITRMFLQSLIIVIFYIAYFGLSNFNGRSGNSQSLTHILGPWAVMIAPALVLLSLFILTYNVLGFERQSLTTLFLFPIPPQYILWGKNLLAFSIGLTEMLILLLLAAAFTNGWLYLAPALAIGLAGIGILIGMGNLTSSFLPQRIQFGSRGFRAMSNLTSEGGCLRAFLSGLAFYGTLFLLIPVILAVVLPVVFGLQWLWIISLPLTLLYGGGIYFGLTRLSWPRLLNKAPEILAIVAKE